MDKEEEAARGAASHLIRSAMPIGFNWRRKNLAHVKDCLFGINSTLAGCRRIAVLMMSSKYFSCRTGLQAAQAKKMPAAVAGCGQANPVSQSWYHGVRMMRRFSARKRIRRQVSPADKPTLSVQGGDAERTSHIAIQERTQNT
jgi:hypothetical protein